MSLVLIFFQLLWDNASESFPEDIAFPKVFKACFPRVHVVSSTDASFITGNHQFSTVKSIKTDGVGIHSIYASQLNRSWFLLTLSLCRDRSVRLKIVKQASFIAFPLASFSQLLWSTHGLETRFLFSFSQSISPYIPSYNFRKWSVRWMISFHWDKQDGLSNETNGAAPTDKLKLV